MILFFFVFIFAGVLFPCLRLLNSLVLAFSSKQYTGLLEARRAGHGLGMPKVVFLINHVSCGGSATHTRTQTRISGPNTHAHARTQHSRLVDTSFLPLQPIALFDVVGGHGGKDQAGGWLAFKPFWRKLPSLVFSYLPFLSCSWSALPPRGICTAQIVSTQPSPPSLPLPRERAKVARSKDWEMGNMDCFSIFFLVPVM